jgi:hypothetical protein
MTTSLLIWSARLLVALVLFGAGIVKVLKLAQFRRALDSARLFNAPSMAVVLIGVPIAEVVLPVWFVASGGSVAATLSVVTLLGAFTAYVFGLRALKRDASCGCFAGIGRLSDPMIARNCGLTALAVAGIRPPNALYLVAAGTGLCLYWAFAVVRRATSARQGAVHARRMEGAHA